jgi:hypothetical protein
MEYCGPPILGVNASAVGRRERMILESQQFHQRRSVLVVGYGAKRPSVEKPNYSRQLKASESPSLPLREFCQLILSVAVARKKMPLRFPFPPMIQGRILERPLRTHRTPPVVSVISQRAR